MPADPNEMAKFKAALMKTPTEAIQKGLDEGIIARDWKREIAEAEVARRKAMAPVSTVQGGFAQKPSAKSVAIKSWLITIMLLIGAVVFVAAYYLQKMPG